MEQRSFPLIGALVLGVMVAAGLALGGFFIGQGFYRARSERYVTVKGLVERNVKADLAIWNIDFTATGDDIGKAGDQIDHDRDLILSFAKQSGFGAGEIAIGQTRVTDRLANPYAAKKIGAGGRYVISSQVTMRASNVDAVRAASQKTGELIKRGIVLGSPILGDGGGDNPAYVFTRLNDIRPAMLADATRSARGVAQQFAIDSQSRLGPIRRASQGVFEILSRDSAGSDNPGNERGSIDKTVRLVTTVDYYLLD